MCGVEHTDGDPAFGEGVSGGAGARSGTVRGFAERGFPVTTGDGIRTRSSVVSARGEAKLTRRCRERSVTDHVRDVPDGCPSRGAAGKTIADRIDD